jgi:hypothetical protein
VTPRNRKGDEATGNTNFGLNRRASLRPYQNQEGVQRAEPVRSTPRPDHISASWRTHPSCHLRSQVRAAIGRQDAPKQKKSRQAPSIAEMPSARIENLSNLSTTAIQSSLPPPCVIGAAALLRVGKTLLRRLDFRSSDRGSWHLRVDTERQQFAAALIAGLGVAGHWRRQSTWA